MVTVARILRPSLETEEIPILYQPIKCDAVLNGTCKVLIQFTNFHYFFDAMDTTPFTLKEVKQLESVQQLSGLIPIDKLRKWLQTSI